MLLQNHFEHYLYHGSISPVQAQDILDYLLPMKFDQRKTNTRNHSNWYDQFAHRISFQCTILLFTWIVIVEKFVPESIYQFIDAAAVVTDRRPSHSSLLRSFASIPQKGQRNRRRRYLQTASGLFSTEIQRLQAADGGFNNFFGDAVAISNNRIVVGAPGSEETVKWNGAAYLFKYLNGRYSQMAVLEASDGLQNDYFGFSVDINNDYIVIGAPGVNSSTGAVYVYQISDNGDRATPLAILRAINGQADDSFGTSVAIDENQILVGAPGFVKNNTLKVGSAYLFTNFSVTGNENPWTQSVQFLLVDDDVIQEGNFGYSVALRGSTAVIGTRGQDAVYVFENDLDDTDDLSWTLRAKLIPSGALEPEGSFGGSVALADNWIVVGADHDDNQDVDAGAAFVFVKDDNNVNSPWSQISKLMARDEYKGRDWFGNSVAISSNGLSIMVGAFYDHVDGNETYYGSFYLFRRDLTTANNEAWTQLQKYIASDRAQYDNLGASVAIENEVAVAGVPSDENSEYDDAGSVYVFNVTVPPTDTSPTPRPSAQSSSPLQPTRTPSPSFHHSTMPSQTPIPTSSIPSSATPTSSTTTTAPTSLTPQPPIDNENDQSTGLSQSGITSLAVIGGVAFVVVIIAGLFFNYRFKVQRELILDHVGQRVQEHDSRVSLPTHPPRGHNGTVESVDAVPMVSDVLTPPVMADVILLPTTTTPQPPGDGLPPKRTTVVHDALGQEPSHLLKMEEDKKYATVDSQGPDFKDQTRSAVLAETPTASKMRTSQINSSPAVDHPPTDSSQP